MSDRQKYFGVLSVDIVFFAMIRFFHIKNTFTAQVSSFWDVRPIFPPVEFRTNIGYNAFIDIAEGLFFYTRFLCGDNTREVIMGSKKANKKYKDRLFNFIFGREENREWTLSLYNAINGSNYTDASLIKFNTLDNILYLDMKNDTSFLISDIVSVYEHQSTFNPNMPLRLMGYLYEIYSGYAEDVGVDKYGSKLIKLPTPKLVVFYNGKTDMSDERILRLSDSFDEKTKDDADVEVKVRMLNINHGRNKEIMEACRPLFEYSWFVNAIREEEKKGAELKTAIERAIDSMPNNYVIKAFIKKHRAEVKRMLDTEYNEEKVLEVVRLAALKEGREEERANTERERARADAECKRADAAEERIKILEAKLAESIR